MAGCDGIIAEYGLPAHTVGMDIVTLASEPVREYRDYVTKIHHDLSDLAWLYHGIFMTPGRDEEWTLSVAHGGDHLARYLEALEGRDVTSSGTTLSCSARVLRATTGAARRSASRLRGWCGTPGAM